MAKYGLWAWERRPFYSPSTLLYFSSFSCWDALLLTYNGKRFLKDIFGDEVRNIKRRRFLVTFSEHRFFDRHPQVNLTCPTVGQLILADLTKSQLVPTPHSTHLGWDCWEGDEGCRESGLDFSPRSCERVVGSGTLQRAITSKSVVQLQDKADSEGFSFHDYLTGVREWESGLQKRKK